MESNNRFKSVQCPICKGKGFLRSRLLLTDTETKIAAVKALVSAGLSYRQVMDIMGYKSPRSISVMLNKQEVKS